MYQFMCELLASPLGLDVAAVWEYGILGVIALVVFLAGGKMLPGPKDDALLHGGLRLTAFIALWAVAYGMIAVAQWVMLNWALALGILAVAVIVLFAVFVMLQGLMCRV